MRYADIGGRTVAWTEVGSGPLSSSVGGGAAMCRPTRKTSGSGASRSRSPVTTASSATTDPDRGSPGATVRHRGNGTKRWPSFSGSPIPSVSSRSRCWARRARRSLSGRGGGPGPGRPARDLWGLLRRRRHRQPCRAGGAARCRTPALGPGVRMLADVFIPGATADERAAFARYQRQVATSQEAARASSPRSMRTTRVTSSVSSKHPRWCCTEARTARSPAHSGATSPTASRRRPSSSWPGRSTSVAGDVVRGHGGDAGVPGRRGPRTLDDAGQGANRPTDPVPREDEVLGLVAREFTDTQIAERLTLSPHTVHRHVSNIRTSSASPRGPQPRHGLPARTRCRRSPRPRTLIPG